MWQIANTEIQTVIQETDFSLCAATLLPNTPSRLWYTPYEPSLTVFRQSRNHLDRMKGRVEGDIWKGVSFSGSMETDHEIHKLLLPIHAEGLVVSTMNNRLLSLFGRISGLNLSWSSPGNITKTVLVYETGCFHQFASDQISFIIGLTTISRWGITGEKTCRCPQHVPFLLGC